jgi:hypothetical protein
VYILEYFYKNNFGWNQEEDTFSIAGFDYFDLYLKSLDIDSLGNPHLLTIERVESYFSYDCCEENWIMDDLEYIVFEGEVWKLAKTVEYFDYEGIWCGECEGGYSSQSGTLPGGASLVLSSKDSAYIIYKVHDYSNNTTKLNLLCPNTIYLIKEGACRNATLRLNASDIPYISYYVSADRQLYLVQIIGETLWPVDTIKLYGNINNNSIKFDIAPDSKSYFLYYSDSLLKLSWKADNDTCKYCIIDTVPNISSSDFSIDNEGKFHAVIMSETEDYKTVYYYTADSILNSYPIIPEPDTQPDVITDFSFNISPLVTNQYINIQYELPSPSNISYKIYDNIGRIIKNISEEKDAGLHSSRIDLGDNPTSIYFINVEVGPLRETKKILLLK